MLRREQYGRVTKEEICRVGETMRRRGPDQQGYYCFSGGALHQNRLAVIDVEKGRQPMTVRYRDVIYTIVYNGEIYNADELRVGLEIAGATFKTRCDTEVVLWAYILYREQSPSMLNGIFAYAILEEHKNEEENCIFLVRDRLGIKPLYYAESERGFVFASEVKGILASGLVRPIIDRMGLWQLFYLAPVTLEGTTVFRDIRGFLPGTCGYYRLRGDGAGLRCFPYFALKAERFDGTQEEAVGITGALCRDAIRRQLKSDVPLCVFLSGGLDSSVVAAVAAEYERESGRVLSTYSFEYEGNKENFHRSLYQPAGDDEYAVSLALRLGTDHMVLTAPTEQVALLLSEAVAARDLPGQADIDSSLLYFCSKVKDLHTFALSGECSDEIFGGYPWFYRPEMLSRDFYPWLHAPRARISLLRPEIALADEGYAVLSAQYSRSVAEAPVLEDDDPAMRQSRIATWLSVRYFMANLLERKDRMSMYSGLEVRVPFGDHRILEFVYNLPWEYKMQNGHEKYLLRSAMRGYLPDDVLWRKKSPYPKTHHPTYELLVRDLLMRRLAREGSALREMLDGDRLASLCESENQTWFGQLMARPQLYAWLCQFDFFCERYHVEFAL